MMYKSSIAMAAAMLSASVVNGHLEMVKPHPYGPGSLNNSPLLANGDDFPCKLRDGVYDPPEAENNMAIGDSQTLSFIGSAVHGGGSCQVSLTEDMQPTAESQWKVIHSIEAGCPASIEGNFAENALSRESNDFKFSIPQGISPGKYTLAWTWFNKVGNREMYMNCAPITVTGGSSKRDDQMQSKREANFPAMFVANIGNGCKVEEGTDVQFPDPGDSVDERDGNLQPPTGSCPSTSPSGGSNSGNSGNSDNSGNSGNSGSTPDTPEPQPQPQPEPEPEPETPSAPEPDTPEAPEEPTQEPSNPAPEPETPSAPSGSGNALSGSCSTEGEWNCIGGSSYQRCASGTWSAAQPLSAGTSCNAGQGAELSMVDSRGIRKRDIHSRRRSIGSQHA